MRGKGGCGPWSAEGRSLVHDKGYYHSYTEGANAPKGTFRPYQPSEPQPRGAVTRRAVAQRRSRAGGLTRRSAAAIRGFRLDGIEDWSHSVSRRETCIVRPLYRSGISGRPYLALFLVKEPALIVPHRMGSPRVAAYCFVYQQIGL